MELVWESFCLGESWGEFGGGEDIDISIVLVLLKVTTPSRFSSISLMVPYLTFVIVRCIKGFS